MDKKERKQLIKSIESQEWSEGIKAVGSFISLASGVTHYELKGEGKLFVLVHGYATPYFIYDRIFEGLLSRGYKVLRYDLLGRGLSERVKKDYTPTLFVTQLRQLIEALGLVQDFYLVGTSMGGIIASSYAAAYPENVKALMLLAPAGMPFNPPFYMKLCKKPILGDFIYKLIGGKTLLLRCSSEMKYSLDMVDYYTRSMAISTRYKGFVRCTLSSMRNTILNFTQSVKGYEQVGKSNLPTLVVWGTNDKTMPYYLSKSLLKYIPSAKLVTYENSGHIFVYDEGERTLKNMLSFIEEI